MANTPKKVKDPTEVALSAIQEALNISEQGTENRSPLNEGAVPPSLPPSAPDFSATSFESRPTSDRSAQTVDVSAAHDAPRDRGA